MATFFSRRIRGMSLVESILTLALTGLLVGLGKPLYSDWIAAQHLANRAYALAQSLNLARSEAIKRGTRVDLCRAMNRFACADRGDWSAGFLIFVDENEDGEPSGPEAILRHEDAGRDAVSISANAPVTDYVSFTPFGHARLLSGALQMGTFFLCRAGQQQLRVILANSGRARIEKTTVRCP